MALGSGVDPPYEEQLLARVRVEVYALIGILPGDENSDDEETQRICQEAEEQILRQVKRIQSQTKQRMAYYG